MEAGALVSGRPTNCIGNCSGQRATPRGSSIRISKPAWPHVKGYEKLRHQCGERGHRLSQEGRKYPSICQEASRRQIRRHQTRGVSSYPPAYVVPATPKPKTVPAATDSCNVSYKFAFDSFEVRGKEIDAAKLGDNRSGLETQNKGCGAVTKLKFKMTPDDPTYCRI